MRRAKGEIGLVVVIVICVLLIGATMLRVNYLNREWEEFKKEHNCRIVGKISASVTSSVGISSSGNVVTTPVVIPSKTGWLCDDGITYYR